MPALPGATKMLAREVPVRTSALTIACSLAPEPKTKIFISTSLSVKNGCVPRRRIKPEDGLQAVTLYRAGDESQKATAVRYLLEELTFLRPGNAVEVRVPPFGAVQCIEGLTHKRGTPPNVVEFDADTWLALAFGELAWLDAVEAGKVHASGTRADLAELLPLMRFN
jgi:hypothetical protein